MDKFWTDKRGTKKKDEPPPKPARDVWVSQSGTYIYHKGEK